MMRVKILLIIAYTMLLVAIGCVMWGIRADASLAATKAELADEYLQMECINMGTLAFTNLISSDYNLIRVEKPVCRYITSESDTNRITLECFGRRIIITPTNISESDTNRITLCNNCGKNAIARRLTNRQLHHYISKTIQTPESQDNKEIEGE